MLVSPRLKGLNTPMKIYSYLDSGHGGPRDPAPDPHPGTRRSDRLPGRSQPSAFGNGLAALLSDPSLRARLASEAKDYVQREFTREAAHRKLASFYETIESRAVGARE